MAAAMSTYLERGWRIFATGLSFLAFGLGGLLLRIGAFPLLRIFIRDPMRRQNVARKLVQSSFRAHVELMRFLGVLSYELHDIERLRQPGLLVLANHPTLIDVVFLISFMDNADCIVKSTLARNPFTRGPIRSCGYVCNDDGAGLIDDCIASLRSGSNLVIFPEGTRTRRGMPMQLQRGAANIAIRGRIDVTPVRLHCEPLTLGKGDKWYRVPPRRFHYSVQVGKSIPVMPFLIDQPQEALAVRRLTEALVQYFSPCNFSHEGLPQRR